MHPTQHKRKRVICPEFSPSRQFSKKQHQFDAKKPRYRHLVHFLQGSEAYKITCHGRRYLPNMDRPLLSNTRHSIPAMLPFLFTPKEHEYAVLCGFRFRLRRMHREGISPTTTTITTTLSTIPTTAAALTRFSPCTPDTLPLWPSSPS